MKEEHTGQSQNVVCRVRVGQPPVSSLVARGTRASLLCRSVALGFPEMPTEDMMADVSLTAWGHSGPCSVETCLKSSETGLSISHQDHSSNFHPGPSANFSFTPCCSSLCVPLHAPASIPFLLLVYLPGTCTVFLTSWAQLSLCGAHSRDPLQQMAGAEGATDRGQSRGGLCDVLVLEPWQWLMRVWRPEFCFGRRQGRVRFPAT